MGVRRRSEVLSSSIIMSKPLLDLSSSHGRQICVTPTAAASDVLVVAVYNGDDTAANLTRDEVRRLRDALTVWLNEPDIGN